MIKFNWWTVLPEVFHFGNSYKLQLNITVKHFTDEYGIWSQNMQLLLWVLRCGQSWTRFLCGFWRMACLWGPVLRSNSATYGSSCSTGRQSFGHPPRSCKPYVPSRPKRRRRWTFEFLWSFSSLTVATVSWTPWHDCVWCRAPKLPV